MNASARATDPGSHAARQSRDLSKYSALHPTITWIVKSIRLMRWHVKLRGHNMVCDLEFLVKLEMHPQKDEEAHKACLHLRKGIIADVREL